MMLDTKSEMRKHHDETLLGLLALPLEKAGIDERN